MKARLVPVYFVQGRDDDFDLQLARLNEMLSIQAEFLPPALGMGLGIQELGRLSVLAEVPRRDRRTTRRQD